MTSQYRQGDVLLIGIDKLPLNAAKEESAGRIVLAFGELTGHAHAISELEAEAYTSNDRRYLVVAEHATLKHEEHDGISLPRGIYRVVRQREYSPQVVHYVED